MVGRDLIAPRRRALLLTVTSALAIWLAAGLHRVPVDPPGEARLHLRRFLGGIGAGRLSPGWHLSPPFLCRVRSFPAGPSPVRLRIGREAPALVSREGAALMAAGVLTVSADPARAEALLSAFPDGWGDEARLRLQERIAPILAGQVRQAGFADLLGRAGGGGDPLSSALARELSAVGLVLGESPGLRFYPVGAASTRQEASAAGAGRRKVLLIGLDGADWEILDPLIAKGKLPHLARLAREGTRARLRTISPVLSPIIWTSIATGVGPEKHGIVDFLATSKTTGQQIPVTSNMRQVKAIWNILSERGRSAGVIAWWATWPAEPVDGFIVSDRVAYQLFGYPDAGASLRGRTYPEALGIVIQPHVKAPAQVTAEEASRVMPAGPEPLSDREELTGKLRQILASTSTYLGIALDLFSAYDPDFKAVYFEGTDTIAHNFMRYRPPAMPGVTPAQLAAYGEVVDRFYERIDEAVGGLLALADEATVVVVCSDHGFRTGANRPPTDPRIEKGGAADWHRKFGVLMMRGPGVKSGVELQEASVLDVTPTLLALLGLPVAQDMAGHALREALEPPPVAATIATYESPSGPGPAGEGREAVPSALDSEIIARLTALGYVGQEGSNALNNTGVTLMDRGRFAEAADAFRRAIRQEPRFDQARINLGRAQMLMKDDAAAVATFEEVLRRDPSQAEVHNLLGNIAMNRGDSRGAERHFRRSLELQPGELNTRNSLGLLYERLGRDDEAIRQFEAVVQVDPDYAEAYNNIGLIHRKRGEPLRAIELFDRAIRADPDFAGSWNNKGLCLQDLGRLDEARSAFLRGLEGDPDNAVMLNNLGTVDLAERKLDDARRRFEEAIRADPDYPSAYNNLGAVLGMQSDPEGALRRYREAVALDPGYADARFNISLHHINAGRIPEGLEALEETLRADPAYAKAHLQMALTLAGQGKLAEALASARRAAGLMPGLPDPLNLQADIQMRLGDRPAARRSLEESLRLRPDQPRVRQALEQLDAVAR